MIEDPSSPGASECRRRSIGSLASRPASPFLHGDYAAAAEDLGGSGAASHEAYARLAWRAKLLAGGKQGRRDTQLQHALAFYRSVGATRYIREAEALLAESA